MASYKMWLMAAALTAAGLLPTTLLPQVSTQGFLNLPRSEVPGTLLSDPYSNDSIYLGRTTTVQYLNGWVIVGGEGPGSATIDGVNRDLHLRIYDISDPAQPIRRLPSDFGLPIGENEWYDGDVWHSGNYGSNAHGSFHVENFLGRPYIYVEEFGGIVQKTNINTTFDLSGKRVDRLGISTNRSGMSGRFNATLSWYEKDDVSFAPFEIKKEVLHEDGRYEKVILATIDHKGEFGGGNWHPIFFGDLLIYVRSGSSASDGVVVYRLQYNDFTNLETMSVTPQLVATLDGGFQGYWPSLYSDGSGLYVLGSANSEVNVADITAAADPNGDSRCDSSW